MNKSILVIDIPECCAKCPLKSQMYDNQYICQGNHRRMVIPGNKNKHDWCPLRDLPEKEDCKNYLDDDEEAYCSGWNTCIDKILGD